MKRIIKFRAWDKDIKKMIGWNIIQQQWLCAGLNDSDGIYVMQFTGLIDKNGREIYEGDIVKTPYYTETVIFTDGSYFTKGKGQHFLTNDPKYFEVIGNIYENPELLK